jgi:branched-chain amino acid transport system substrate-binding protein
VAFARRWAQPQGKKVAFCSTTTRRAGPSVLEDLAKTEGFELRTFAVPAPGLEMGAGLGITNAQAGLHHHPPDRALTVSLHQGAQGQGLPTQQVVAFV